MSPESLKILSETPPPAKRFFTNARQCTEAIWAREDSLGIERSPFIANINAGNARYFELMNMANGAKTESSSSELLAIQQGCWELEDQLSVPRSAVFDNLDAAKARLSQLTVLGMRMPGATTTPTATDRKPAVLVGYELCADEDRAAYYRKHRDEYDAAHKQWSRELAKQQAKDIAARTTTVNIGEYYADVHGVIHKGKRPEPIEVFCP